MADETPIQRVQALINRLPGTTGIMFDRADIEAILASLAAALDPRTTEVLFEQRDTAIAERDRLRLELEAAKFAANEADLDRIDAQRLLVGARTEFDRLVMLIRSFGDVEDPPDMRRLLAAVDTYRAEPRSPTEHPREDT